MALLALAVCITPQAEALMTAVWEDPGASFDRTVDAHIKTIRGKVRAIEPAAEPIKTHRGMGYSWTAVI